MAHYITKTRREGSDHHIHADRECKQLVDHAHHIREATAEEIEEYPECGVCMADTRGTIEAGNVCENCGGTGVKNQGGELKCVNCGETVRPEQLAAAIEGQP